MGLVRNAASLLLTKVAGIPVALASSIILARYLNVSDRGVLGVAIALGTSLVILSQLGWPSAAIYRLRRVGSEPAQVSSAALLTIGLVSALTIVVCLALEPRLMQWLLSQASSRVLYLVLAMVPFQLMGLYFSAIARGLDRFPLQNWYALLNNTGRLGALAWVLVIGRGAVVEVLIAVLLVQAATALGLAISVIRHTGLRLRPDVSESTQTLRFGLKTWVHTLAGNIHERVDVFMLAFFLQDPAQVAFYVIAVGVLEYLKLVPESIAVAMLPNLAELEEERAGALAASSIRHALVWVMLSVLIAAPTAPLLIPLLYGNDYGASIVPFLILLPGMAFLTLYRLLARYFLTVNRQGVNITVQVLSTILNIGLNVWLIPRYGILGAAAASLASYSLEGLALSVIFLRSVRRGAREAFLFQRSDFAPYRVRLEPALRRWKVIR